MTGRRARRVVPPHRVTLADGTVCNLCTDATGMVVSKDCKSAG